MNKNKNNNNKMTNSFSFGNNKKATLHFLLMLVVAYTIRNPTKTDTNIHKGTGIAASSSSSSSSFSSSSSIFVSSFQFIAQPQHSHLHSHPGRGGAAANPLSAIALLQQRRNTNFALNSKSNTESNDSNNNNNNNNNNKNTFIPPTPFESPSFEFTNPQSQSESTSTSTTTTTTEIKKSSYATIAIQSKQIAQNAYQRSIAKNTNSATQLTSKAFNATLLLLCFGFAFYSVLSVDDGMTRGWSITEKAMRIPLDNWSSYESSLNQQPIFTKTMINVVIYLLGDWLSQTLFVKKNLLEFDAYRTMKNGFIGMVFGPLVHEYYEFSDSILPVEIGMNRFYKIFMDQTIYLSVKCSVYIVAVKMLGGESWDDASGEAKSKIKGIMFTAWKFWPLVHCVTYGAIPARHRILWVNCVDLFWNAILASMTSGDASDDASDDDDEVEDGTEGEIGIGGAATSNGIADANDIIGDVSSTMNMFTTADDDNAVTTTTTRSESTTDMNGSSSSSNLLLSTETMMKEIDNNSIEMKMVVEGGGPELKEEDIQALTDVLVVVERGQENNEDNAIINDSNDINTMNGDKISSNGNDNTNTNGKTNTNTNTNHEMSSKIRENEESNLRR